MAFWKKKPKSEAPPQLSRQAAAIDGACRSKAPATLIVPDARWVVAARFLELAEDVMTLQVVETAAPLSVPAMVCVTFVSDDRPAVFLGSAIAQFDQDGMTHVLVQMPEQIAGAEARAAFRVPVRDYAVTVEVAQAPACVAPEVRDISPLGLQFEYPKLEDPQFSVGDRLTLRLQIAEFEHSLEAVVCRAKQGTYGVRFPESVKDDGVEAADALRSIVRAAERRWLEWRRATAAAA